MPIEKQYACSARAARRLPQRGAQGPSGITVVARQITVPLRPANAGRDGWYHSLPSSACMPFPITLNVSPGSRAPAASARHREPVTIGVPFPHGQLRVCEDLLLLDASGTATPFQARILDRWADESIRWALIDFQAEA